MNEFDWHFPAHSSTEPRYDELPGKVVTICGMTKNAKLRGKHWKVRTTYETDKVSCKRCVRVIRIYPQLMNLVLQERDRSVLIYRTGEIGGSEKQ